MSTIHYLSLDSLSTKAQLLAKQRHRSTILQFDAELRDDCVVDEYSGRTGRVCLPHENKPAFAKSVRMATCVNFFAKPFELVDGKPPEEVVKATLNAYGRLVDAGLIDHAVMLPPCWISLAPPTDLQVLNASRHGLLNVKPDVAEAHDMIPEWVALSYQRRQPSPTQGAMLFFVFGALPWMIALDYPRKYMGKDQLFLHDLLNEALGTDAFGLEGRLASPDWCGLLPDEMFGEVTPADTIRALAFDSSFGQRALDHKRGIYHGCPCGSPLTECSGQEVRMPTSNKSPQVTKKTAFAVPLRPGMKLFTMALLNQKTNDDGLPTIQVDRVMPKTVVVRAVNFTGWGFVRGRAKPMSIRELQESWEDYGPLTAADLQVLGQDVGRLGAEARGVSKALRKS